MIIILLSCSYYYSYYTSRSYTFRNYSVFSCILCIFFSKCSKNLDARYYANSRPILFVPNCIQVEVQAINTGTGRLLDSYTFIRILYTFIRIQLSYFVIHSPSFLH